MSPMDRLLLEAVPDGTFGGARAPRRRGKTPARGPDPNAAQHLADLAAAIRRPARRTPAR